MPLDIQPLPAHAVGGGTSPEWSLTPVSDVRVFAAGDEWVDPDAPPRCPELTKRGEPCKAFAGESGVCVGHQKVAEAAERKAAE